MKSFTQQIIKKQTTSGGGTGDVSSVNGMKGDVTVNTSNIKDGSGKTLDSIFNTINANITSIFTELGKKLNLTGGTVTGTIKVVTDVPYMSKPKRTPDGYRTFFLGVEDDSTGAERTMYEVYTDDEALYYKAVDVFTGNKIILRLHPSERPQIQQNGGEFKDLALLEDVGSGGGISSVNGITGTDITLDASNINITMPYSPDYPMSLENAVVSNYSTGQGNMQQVMRHDQEIYGLSNRLGILQYNLQTFTKGELTPVTVSTSPQTIMSYTENNVGGSKILTSDVRAKATLSIDGIVDNVVIHIDTYKNGVDLFNRETKTFYHDNADTLNLTSFTEHQMAQGDTLEYKISKVGTANVVLSNGAYSVHVFPFETTTF